jgi:hypothetical protein
MDLLKIAGAYALARLGEASTWSTLVAWSSAELHIQTSGDFNTAFVHFGLAAAALAGVLIKEGWQAKKEAVAAAQSDILGPVPK